MEKTISLQLTRYYHPVMPAKNLGRKPVAVQIGDEKIALWKTRDGKLAAVEDRCPHRFTPLSAGRVTESGRLACVYHGWATNEKGAVDVPGVNTVKNCKITAYSLIEKHSYIWVGRDENSLFPDLHSDAWVTQASYAMDFPAPLHVVLDNFSEDEHFPYVHKILGWDEGGANEVQYDCQVAGDEVKVEYCGPQRSFFGMRLLMAKPGQYFTNRWTARFDPVRINYTSNLTDKKGVPVTPITNRVVIFFVPEGTSHTKMHVFQLAKHENPKMNFVLKLLAPMGTYMVKKDLERDIKITKVAAKVPYGFKGMRLGKYDKALFHGRKLLDRVYYGKSITEDIGVAPEATL